MRIMHVISSPAAGGAEVFVRDLSIAMASAGHYLVIVFISRSADIGRDITFEQKFLEILDSSNIPYSFVGHSARRLPFLGILKLWKLARHHQPDIIHNHLSYAVVFTFLLRKPKLVFTYHNNAIKEPAIFFKFVHKFIHGVVGISRICQQSLSAVVPGKIFRIDNGVDSNRLKSNGSEKKSDIFTIAMVGHLSKQKNYPLAIKAAAMLGDLNFQIVIAGEGPDKEKIKDLVHQHDLEEKIKCVGNIVDISTYLRSADLFLMSSEWEGLPIGLIEATLCGLPVVVTDAGGCSELVTEVGNGIVVPLGDPAKLSAAIRKLVESSALREQYANCATLNSGNYTIQRATTQYLDLYALLLSKKTTQTEPLDKRLK